MRRAFALSTICTAVAAITPAASGADPHVWKTTATPQTTLKIAGRGFRVSALSTDGRVAVVADARAVYLFRASSERSWGSVSKPTARLRVPRTRLENLTAVAVSSDGRTVLVAVGAVGRNQAAVYVFHAASLNAWKPLSVAAAKLTSRAGSTGFGAGVALSSDGTTALVGTLGGADIFQVAAADSWRDSSTPTATLIADPIGEEVGGLSTSVGLSADGTTALVGVTSNHTFVGAADIFRVAGMNTWVSSATPDAVLTDGYAGEFGDGFGAAVALSPDGTTALVGAPDLAHGSAGAAYLFQVRTPHAWASSASPATAFERDGDGRSGDVPGWSVALSDEGTALVGEPSLLGGPGSADVFHVAGQHGWRFGRVTQATLTNAASPPRDLLGGAVALSSDGTTALVSSVRGAFMYTQSGSVSSDYCYVPYVVGDVLRTAKTALESTRCKLGKVSWTSASSARSGRVISQRPEPGKRLAKRARVDLRIGKRG